MRGLMRRAIALVRVAAKTQMFAGVARELNAGIWVEEDLARGREWELVWGADFL